MSLYEEDEIEESEETSILDEYDAGELREMLLEIDSDEDIIVSEWEADFIESICFKYTGSLSSKQMASAHKIIAKYHPDFQKE